MKGLYITLVIALLTSIRVSSATPPDSLVELGNRAYNNANYQQAIENYLSVIDVGYGSAGLFYNLANSYFKLNDIPSAILYYEKALKLNPKDEDINFNLRLANSRIIDKIEPVPEFFLKKWWKQTVHLMGPDQWARLAIAFFVVFLILLSMFIVSRSVTLRKTAFWMGTILLAAFVFSIYTGYYGHLEIKQQHEGIIFTPTVTVKSSPAENSVDLFVIHEGTKVRLLDEVEQWTEIRIANGSVGWIRSEDYQPI
jgi:tetratricopeptide (TPR) repeat protein